MDACLHARNLTKSFARKPVVHAVDFTVNRGEIISIIGPSGCGKTTLLRMIAGLERPDQGRLTLDGAILDDVPGGIHLPPELRRMGMVFQDYALWPHLTVRQNVAMPLHAGRRRIKDRTEARDRVDGLLRLCAIEAFGTRYPAQLSGGQQQRVALARALAGRPGVLLLDEPFSALDAGISRALRDETGVIVREQGITVIQVTHDQEEAFSSADRVIVMNDGIIVQSGPPAQLYAAPADRFVASFIGRVNLLEAVAVPEGDRLTVRLQTAGPPVRLSGRVLPREPGDGWLMIRPEHLTLEPFNPGPEPEPAFGPGGTTGERSVLTGRVRACHFALDKYRIQVHSPDAGLVTCYSGKPYAPDTPVRLLCPADGWSWLPRTAGESRPGTGTGNDTVRRAESGKTAPGKGTGRLTPWNRARQRNMESEGRY